MDASNQNKFETKKPTNTTNFQISRQLYRQLRARRALTIYKDVPLKTRRALMIYKDVPMSTRRALTIYKDVPLRTRRALTIYKDVPLRTRRALSLYKFYGDSALLVLNRTLLNSVNALLALSWHYNFMCRHTQWLFRPKITKGDRECIFAAGRVIMTLLLHIAITNLSCFPLVYMNQSMNLHVRWSSWPVHGQLTEDLLIAGHLCPRLKESKTLIISSLYYFKVNTIAINRNHQYFEKIATIWTKSGS